MASWEFVAVGGGSTVTSGNFTATEPAGAASGDLLVCVLAYRDSAAFTAPAGWTIVEQESTGNVDVALSTSIASGLIAYIIRGGSAPSYVFTRTGGDVALGRVACYRPVGGTVTFDESNAVTLGAASTSVSMSGVTTDGADSLIVMGLCGGSNSAGTVYDAATDPSTDSGVSTDATAGTIAAGAWKRRVSVTTTSGADTSVGVADAVKATAGATGDLSCTAVASRRHVLVAAAFTLTSSAAPIDGAASGSATAVGAARRALSGSGAASGAAASAGAVGKRGPVAATATTAATASGAALKRAPGSAVAAVVSIATGQTARSAPAAGDVTASAAATADAGTREPVTAAASASSAAVGSARRSASILAFAQASGAATGTASRAASIRATATGTATVLAFVNRSASATASATGQADATGAAFNLDAGAANGNAMIDRRRRRTPVR